MIEGPNRAPSSVSGGDPANMISSRNPVINPINVNNTMIDQSLNESRISGSVTPSQLNNALPVFINEDSRLRNKLDFNI